MKRILVLLFGAATLGLSACTTQPKQTDPFDTAMANAFGVIAGGIINTNPGGAL